MAVLSEVLGYPVLIGDLVQRLQQIEGRVEHVALVAELPQVGVVGWIHANERQLLVTGRTCEILGLVIGREQRQRGLGRALVEAIEHWAVHRGLDHIVVRSNVARPESHPFYERIGYCRFKTQHVYKKSLRPARSAKS